MTMFGNMNNQEKFNFLSNKLGLGKSMLFDRDERIYLIFGIMGGVIESIANMDKITQINKIYLDSHILTYQCELTERFHDEDIEGTAEHEWHTNSLFMNDKFIRAIAKMLLLTADENGTVNYKIPLSYTGSDFVEVKWDANSKTCLCDIRDDITRRYAFAYRDNREGFFFKGINKTLKDLIDKH